VKVLFIDQFSDFGGAQIGLVEMLDEVVSRGWKAMVLAPGNGPLHRACAERGIPSETLPLASYAHGHKTARDMLRYGFDCSRAARVICGTARRLQPDLVYVNGPRVLPAAVLAERSTHCPTIFHSHSYPECWSGRVISRCCVGWAGMLPCFRCRAVFRSLLRAGSSRRRCGVPG
jgi:hypothetical protein